MESRKILILYGSETGNAQDYAETLSLNYRYQGYQATVSAMDDFPAKDLLDFHVLLVICSTTGQGEVPRNARHFWRFLLRKSLPNDLLSHIRFSTFGLGDSSYPQYNWAIRKIHARLLQLGAKELCDRGESDEQFSNGSEAYFAAWTSVLAKSLPKLFPDNNSSIKQNVDLVNAEILPPSFHLLLEKYKFKRLTDLDIKNIALSRDPMISTCRSDRLPAQFEVISNDRITSEDHFQDVRRLVLHKKDQTTGKMPQFIAGDTLALYPTNDKRDVDDLIRIQGWEDVADYPLKIKCNKSGSGRSLSVPGGGFVKKLTLRSLITHHLDIMSVPKRSFFLQASQFTSDERERDKLIELTRLEETQQLYDYANRPRRSILETIQEFFSLKIPLDYILDIIPLIKPRLFSISSRCRRPDEPDFNSLELTIGIVEYKTVIRRIRRGLCTRWIRTLNSGDVILGTVEHSRSKFRDDDGSPVILAYTGTGVAPVKCFVEDQMEKEKAQRRALFIFSGNRYPKKDFLYGDLWRKLEDEGIATEFPAFSRDPEYVKKGRHYVFDRLYQEKKIVNDALVNKLGVFYLCGSAGKMPVQVRITLETIFREENGWTEEQAKKYLIDMETSGRYIQDTW